jgi:phosphonopyruvate decarboxylase
MLPCDAFYNLLLNKNINFLCGVPDSQLKSFLAYIADHADKDKNIIAANEGNAIALAAGYYLATGKIGMVYMQNSGLCNAINPLTSLVDKEVYSIPMLLLIGWRGEPGKKDEPQHVKLGRVTQSLLNSLEIPFSVLPDDMVEVGKVMDKSVALMKENNAPYALMVRKGAFEKYDLKSRSNTSYPLYREDAIKLIIPQLSARDIIVSTTGMASRELFEYRDELKQDHNKDFLTVGSMGHCSQIALAIALSKPSRNIYCLDGDGSLIMHMGALPIISSQNPENFRHIVINNGAHDSVGGQPTVGFEIDITTIAKASGYKYAFRAETGEEICEKINLLKERRGPSLLEIRVNKGARQNLGRPTISPVENKRAFMNFINNAS